MICAKFRGDNVDEAVRIVLRYSVEVGGVTFTQAQLTRPDHKGKVPLDCYLGNVSIDRSQDIIDQLMPPEESISQYTRDFLENESQSDGTYPSAV